MKIIGHSESFEINIDSDISHSKEIFNWKEEWINFEFIIKLPGFYSEFNIQLIGSDIYRFVNSLTEAYNSSFSNNKQEVLLDTLEESIYLKGVIDYKGAVEWEGYVIYPIGDGNKLSFKFESELNAISNARDQLMQECSFMFNLNSL